MIDNINNIAEFEKRYDGKNRFAAYQFFDAYTCNEEVLEYYINNYTNVNWVLISRLQKLSEPFIEKYKDNVNWSNISRYQVLSVQFIIKYIDKIDWIDLFNNINIDISYEFTLEYLYKFSLYDVYHHLTDMKHKPVLENIINEFPDKFIMDKVSYELNE